MELEQREGFILKCVLQRVRPGLGAEGQKQIRADNEPRQRKLLEGGFVENRSFVLLVSCHLDSYN